MNPSDPASPAPVGGPPRYRPTTHAALKALLQDDVLGEQERIHEAHGDIVQIQAFGTKGVIVTRDPEHVAHVLVRNGGNYLKLTPVWRELRTIFGEGIFTSEGDAWRSQRQMIQPMLHNYRIGAFAPVMTRCAMEAVDGWTARIARGEPIDIADETARVTLRIVCQCLFGVDVATRVGSFVGALDEVKAYVDFRNRAGKLAPRAELLAMQQRCAPAVQQLQAIAQEIIEERRRGSGGDDLLSALLSFRDETGDGLSEQRLRDEILGMLIAGHETTAGSLTWTLHLLASHPDVDQGVREELSAALEGRAPTLSDLPRLPRLDRVVKETLRLYPPGFVFDRMAVADDTLGGYHVPAGMSVGLSVYLAQRHPRYWDNPNTFDPDRFLPENVGLGVRQAYFPFGLGKRACLGSRFALVEMQLVLATMLGRMTFRSTSGAPKEADPGLTLRPSGGLLLFASPCPTRA